MNLEVVTQCYSNNSAILTGAVTKLAFGSPLFIITNCCHFCLGLPTDVQQDAFNVAVTGGNQRTDTLVAADLGFQICGNLACELKCTGRAGIQQQ